MVEVTSYTHEKLEVKNKENQNDIVVYLLSVCLLSQLQLQLEMEMK